MARIIISNLLIALILLIMQGTATTVYTGASTLSSGNNPIQGVIDSKPYWAGASSESPTAASQPVKFSSWVERSSRTGVSPYVPGTLIVRFTPSGTVRVHQALERGNWGAVGLNSLKALNERYRVLGFAPLFPVVPNVSPTRVALSGIYQLRFPPDTDILMLASEYAALPEVEWAEPDYLAHAAFIPNDPLYTNQWGLPQIQAPQAWDVTQGTPVITIAIVDTGVDLNHPDLRDKLWINPGEVPGDGIDNDNNGKVDDINGWDWVNNDNIPQDDIGHGTHVAGIAAAATSNGMGIAGVCPNCRVMALKVLDAAGSGTYSNIAAGIIYAAEKGARVINLSLGGYAESQLLRDAVAYASQTAVIVAAAGNENRQDRFYPAAYDEYVIAVAATDSNDQRAAFSNYGGWVDISAPGVSIWSTLYDDTYAAWSGSSMATPFVSGVAGLVWSKNLPWSAGAVRGQLLHTTDNIDGLNPGYEGKLGAGRVNAYRAVTVTAQPELSVVGYAINGMPNGNPEPGGTVTMTVTLRNTWSDAAGVTAVLSTTDPYVVLVDDTAHFGDIYGHVSVSNVADAFAFWVDPNAPYNYPIPFALMISGNGGNYTTTLPITVPVSSGIVYISGVINQDTTWVADRTYVINGNVLISGDYP